MKLEKVVRGLSREILFQVAGKIIIHGSQFHGKEVRWGPRHGLGLDQIGLGSSLLKIDTSNSDDMVAACR